MRLIDADALNDILEYMINEADIKSWEYIKEPVVAHHYEMLKQQIEEILTGISGLPTIESERKKGKWLRSGNCIFPYECDRCGDTNERATPFCPNCGADMRQRGEQYEKD